MLNPSDDVVDWVLKTVPTMGAGWCPPGMLGIGIGGTAEKAMLLAKQSLMEDLDMHELRQRGPRNRTEELRIELYDQINALGIGAQGLGGLTTVLDVKIWMAPTHAASQAGGDDSRTAPRRATPTSCSTARAPRTSSRRALDLWPDVHWAPDDQRSRRVNLDALTRERGRDAGSRATRCCCRARC